MTTNFKHKRGGGCQADFFWLLILDGRGYLPSIACGRANNAFNARRFRKEYVPARGAPVKNR